jgi:hypothetical protein
MDTALEQLIRRRAQNACEYCRLPQNASRLTFPIDHVIAQQHEGQAIESNLASVISTKDPILPALMRRQSG